MTNGEKIQTILDVDKDCTEVHGENGTMTFTVTQDWWNAEYKEPTTKNGISNRTIIYKAKESKEIQKDLDKLSELNESTTKNDLTDNKTFYEQIVEYCNEHFLVLVEKDVWEDAEKALTTKNDLGIDCISRQAVLEQAYAYGNGLEPDGYCVNVEDIQALPPVTPIRPKGHWISHIEHCKQNNLLPSGLGGYFWCSECDCGVDSKVFHRVNYNYCPNCGCKMR